MLLFDVRIKLLDKLLPLHDPALHTNQFTFRYNQIENTPPHRKRTGHLLCRCALSLVLLISFAKSGTAENSFDGEMSRLIQELGTKNDTVIYEQLKLLIKKYNNDLSTKGNHHTDKILQQDSWKGELEVMVVDHTNVTGEIVHAKNIYNLNTLKGTLQLFFLDGMDRNPAMSGKIRVWGYKSGERILVEKINTELIP